MKILHDDDHALPMNAPEAISERFSPPRYLITRGDDGGLTRGVNQALSMACDNGFLRNVSILAVAPEAEHAVSVFRDRHDIAIGLHATLTCEWTFPSWPPLTSEAPDLVDHRGCLPVAVSELKDRISLEHALNEVRAQLAKLRKLGARPTYLDDHMAFTCLPDFKAAFYHLACEEGLIFGPTQFNNLPDLTESINSPAVRFVQRISQVHRETHLMFFHPGFEDDPDLQACCLPGQSPGIEAGNRARDLAICLAPGSLSAMKSHNILPVRYDEVFRIGDRSDCPDW